MLQKWLLKPYFIYLFLISGNDLCLVFFGYTRSSTFVLRFGLSTIFAMIITGYTSDVEIRIWCMTIDIVSDIVIAVVYWKLDWSSPLQHTGIKDTFVVKYICQSHTLIWNRKKKKRYSRWKLTNWIFLFT